MKDSKRELNPLGLLGMLGCLGLLGFAKPGFFVYLGLFALFGLAFLPIPNKDRK